MKNNSISPIEAVNAAIASQNPFMNAGIAKEQDVWGKGFPDVPTLNAHASDAVFQAIELVRSSESSQDKVTSIAITASYGVGKTHLLSRVRHRLETEGGALFIYAGVNNYTDLNLVKYQFQQTLADSLSKTGSQGVMQWQEVAAAMANQGFKAMKPDARNLSPQELIDRFDKVSKSWLTKNKSLIDTLTNKVLKTKPNTDPYIVRAILLTLSETQASFAIKWLSGEELAESNANVLGLPLPDKTNQNKEAEALKRIQQILNLVSYYNPIVICFDEIDVKNNSTDDGLLTEQVVADLVKRLHDTLEQSELSRGVVIVTVMLPDTWTHKVDLMTGGTPDRISKYTRRKPIDLKQIDGNSMIELATVWLKDFYDSKNLVPPDSIYPFKESEIINFGKGKPTIREALKWCAEKFKVDEEQFPADPLERFNFALEKEGDSEDETYLENNELLADTLRFGFQTLIGEILEGETSTGEKLNKVTIEDVIEVEPKSKNQGWINFKVTGKEKNTLFKIGVAILQHSNGRSVGAGMQRLIEYKTFDITRGCLVRSQDKKILKNWDSYKHLKKLVEELGGEHVDLIADEIKPLINIYRVYQKRDSYQLSDEQIRDFSKALTLENNLLREILSDPSGEIDAQIIEDEIQLLEDFLNPSNIEDTEDEDELDELFN